MTEIELLKKQRGILSCALRTIATNSRTPDWIKELCKKEVHKARSLEKGEPSAQVVKETVGEKNDTFGPGDLVRNKDEKDSCVYQLLEISTVMDNIRLWNIRILKGDAKNPAGLIVHNVPENKFLEN